MTTAKKKIFNRAAAVLMIIVMFAAVFELFLFDTHAGIDDYEIVNEITISESGTSLQLEEGQGYIITVEEGVESLTIVGCGAEWTTETYDDDGNYVYGTMTSTPNGLLLDATASPGITVTLSNVYISNEYNYANTIDFSGEGNTLIIDGTCVMDTDNNAYGYAAIHVDEETSLNVYGTSGSTFYFYKREQGAGIGGNSEETNGTITFGIEGGSNDFYFFMKGTKQGALIGAGSNSSSSDSEPGAITFYSGVYYLITNSRAAAIGGSAGSLASSGTTVYNYGALININQDYTGAAIGGGGYSSGNDSSGGILYVEGGTIRPYIDYNAASNTTGYNDIEYTAGVNEAAIHSDRYDTDDHELYFCAVDTSYAESTDRDLITLEVDDTTVYTGPMYNYSYIQETLDKANQYEVTSTPSNWVYTEEETYMYLFLTGEDHVITINGTEVTYVFDESTGTFSVEGESTSYSVAFGGVTQDMTVEVFDSDGESVGTGHNFTLADGDYTYIVYSDDEEISSGSFTVAGEALSISIEFTVSFDVTPADAVVVVSGEEGQSGEVVIEAEEDGTYRLQAGTGYMITISADGYETYSGTFDVTKDEVFTYVLTASETVLGDVDGNGTVNTRDAILIMRAQAGVTELDSSASLAADVDGDGSITEDDAMLVLNYAAGNITGF